MAALPAGAGLWPRAAWAQAESLSVIGSLLPLTMVVALVGISLTVMIVAANRNIANQRVRRFRAATGVGRTTIVFVALSAAVEVGLAYVLIQQLELMGAAFDGELVDIGEAERSDRLVRGLTGGGFLLLVITGTAFATWLSRVRANLGAMGVDDARWGPGWAVGWWFVPIMNLLRPYQLTAEVYRASTATTSDWQDQRAGIVGWWWFFWLAGTVGAIAPGLIYVASERAYLRGDIATFQRRLLTSTYADILACILTIAGSITMIVLIRHVNARQLDRWKGRAQAEVFGEEEPEAGGAPRPRDAGAEAG